MKNKYLVIAIVLAGVVSLAFFSNEVEANPSQITDTKSVVATTSVAYMTPGNATTTRYFDAQSDGGLAADSAALAIIMNASSSLGTLNLNLEYAQGTSGIDCTATPTSCEWFADNLDSGVATTSPIIALQIPRSYSWPFASSTPGMGAGVGSAMGQTARKVISVATPMRYVRAVFTVPIGAGNASVWAEWITKRENR